MGSTLSITLILFASLFLSKFNFALENRSKRFALFLHKGGGPKMCIHMGLGLPVHVELESVIVGYGLTAKFTMPSNASQIWSELTDPFDVKPIAKREITQLNDYENEHEYNSEADALDDHKDEPNNLPSMRWTVYKVLAQIAERHGFAGRSCVLRSICESAHTPFDHSSGILGELLHVVMSPSLTNEEILEHEDNEYLYAEAMGKDGAPCDRIFNECNTSLLDLFAMIESFV